MPDGSVTFSMPGTPLFPEDLVVVDPVTDLSVRSAAARTTLHLGYFTSGAQWMASYQVIFGSRRELPGHGCGRDRRDQLIRADSAEVQLLAGAVSQAVRRLPWNRRRLPRRQCRPIPERTPASSISSRKGSGDSHLYSLPGPLTLQPGITTSVTLFEPTTNFLREELRSWRGAVPMPACCPRSAGYSGDPGGVQVHRQTRSADRVRGSRPARRGRQHVRGRQSGRLQLVGAGLDRPYSGGTGPVPHAGTAFDLTARGFRLPTPPGATASGRPGPRPTIRSNWPTRPTIGSIDVLEQRGRGMAGAGASVPGGETTSSTTTRFRVTVPANGEAVLTYRVRVKW